MKYLILPCMYFCFVVMGVVTSADAQWQVTKKDVNGDGAPDLVIKGKLLSATVNGFEGGLMRLTNNLNGRLENKIQKIHPAEGINKLRIKQSADYTLSYKKTSDGRLIAIAKHVGEVEIGGEPIEPVAITKTYIFEPGATRIRIETRIQNKSDHGFAMMPWIKHLLKGTALPTSFMTKYGACRRYGPYSAILANHQGTNMWCITPSNWISRTTKQSDKQGDTLATVVNPKQLYKVYNWRKKSEDFMTQEVIFKPLHIAPGKLVELAYYLTLTKPLPAPSYASPLLNIEVDPFPTGISASTDKLTFKIAVTKKLGKLNAHGKLVPIDGTSAEVQTIKLQFENVGTRNIATATAPVKLIKGGRYHLILRLTKNGKEIHPGSAIGDKRPVIIPLIVGKKAVKAKRIVYKDKNSRGNIFKHIKPRHVKAPQVGSFNGVKVFQYPAFMRAFEKDNIVKKSSEPIDMSAPANAFQSLQLVFTSHTNKSRNYSVKVSPLTNKNGDKIRVDRVNRFLYAKTTVPSHYDPSIPIGNYPDALLKTNSIKVKPGITTPLYVIYHIPKQTPAGKYTGVIELRAQGKTHTLSVTMKVWNFELPSRPTADISASEKRGTSKGKEMQKMYLHYKVTPNPSRVTGPLEKGNFKKAAKIMKKLIAHGVSRIYLGNSKRLLRHPKRVVAIDQFLKKHGWLDYFYVRPGMDELSPDRVDELIKRCKKWHEVSSIDIMSTYYYKPPKALFGNLNIYARDFSDAAWVKKRLGAGDTFWKVNAFPRDLEVAPWRSWVRYWHMEDVGFSGTYIYALTSWREKDWGHNWWSSTGNLQATLIWHWDNGKKLLPTIRLVGLRGGIQGYDMLNMLKERVKKSSGNNKSQALKRARKLLSGKPLWKRIKSGWDVQRLRREVGDLLSALNEKR